MLQSAAGGVKHGHSELRCKPTEKKENEGGWCGHVLMIRSSSLRGMSFLYICCSDHGAEFTAFGIEAGFSFTVLTTEVLSRLKGGGCLLPLCRCSASVNYLLSP